jgi:hypothetical protein
MNSYSYTVEQYERLEDECRKQRAIAKKLMKAIEDHKKLKWDDFHCRHDAELWEVLK